MTALCMSKTRKWFDKSHAVDPFSLTDDFVWKVEMNKRERWKRKEKKHQQATAHKSRWSVNLCSCKQNGDDISASLLTTYILCTICTI